MQIIFDLLVHIYDNDLILIKFDTLLIFINKEKELSKFSNNNSNKILMNLQLKRYWIFQMI